MRDKDYLTDLFINEAKPALDRHSGSGSADDPAMAEELAEQDSIIEQIQTALKGKAAGSGGGENKLAQVVDGSVTEITASDLSGTTSIGKYAFYSCAMMERVTIPPEITNIGIYALYECTRIKEINFRATSMGNFISSDHHIFQSAGRNGEGITLNIGENVTRIPGYLFYPGQVQNYPNYIPNIKRIVFEDNCQCTYIGSYAFYRCPIETVDFGKNCQLAEIGTSAFIVNGVMKNIKFPKTLKKIGANNFNSFTSMEYYDFTDCESIPTLAADYVFGSIPEGCEIRVPAALYDAWIAATNWSKFADYIVK